MKRFEIEGLQKPQDLDVFSLAGLAHARLQQTAQGRERVGQFPAGQRRGLIQGGDLLFQQRQIVDRIEDHIIPLVRTGGPGDDPAAATDNHLMDIATDPDLPVAVGDGHGIVIRPVAHQRQGADPRALPVAGIERRRRQNHQRFAIAPEALADSLTVAAHDLALPVAALFLQRGIEGVPARKPGTRHHKVPPGVANHPFYIAFIVALAGAAVAVLEQGMGLQPAERPGPLPRAVRQDARHQTLVVVVENRLGNPAEEGKGRIVPVQPSLRRRRRVGRNKAGIAVRKRHDEKMRAMHDAGNDRIRLAKVRLGMTRRVRQRHEHLPQTKVPFVKPCSSRRRSKIRFAVCRCLR